METVAAILATWVFSAVVLPASLAWISTRRHAESWSRSLREPEIGEGAYRSGATAVRHRTPTRIVAAAMAAFVWASVTLLGFVPLGALAILIISAFGGPYVGWAFIFLRIVLVLAIVSGIAHAVSLYVVARRMIHRSPRAASALRAVALHGRMHHGALALSFVLTIAELSVGSVAGNTLMLMVFVVFACGAGWLVAKTLESAADLVDAA